MSVLCWLSHCFCIHGTNSLTCCRCGKKVVPNGDGVKEVVLIPVRVAQGVVEAASETIDIVEGKKK